MRKRERAEVERINYAVPVYESSGLLLQGGDKDAAPKSVSLLPPSQSSAPSRWIPDENILPQVILNHITAKGTMPLRWCVALVPTCAEHPLVKAKLLQPTADGDALSSSCNDVDLFPQQLTLALRKDGKFLTLEEAGLHPSNSLVLVSLTRDQAAILFGRDRAVVDIPLDHPSCSSQHAVIANRLVFDATGGCEEEGSQTSPELMDLFDLETVIMDLGSTNGTRVNQQRVAPFSWVVLRKGDCVEFGLSQRQYVVVTM